jgi:hypothetical protein
MAQTRYCKCEAAAIEELNGRVGAGRTACHEKSQIGIASNVSI